MKSIYFLTVLSSVLSRPAPSVINNAGGIVQSDNGESSTNNAIGGLDWSLNNFNGPKILTQEKIVEANPVIIEEVIESPRRPVEVVVVDEVDDREVIVLDEDFITPRRIREGGIIREDNAEAFIEAEDRQEQEFIEDLANRFFGGDDSEIEINNLED